MSPTIPDITLAVELRNPGQFFACCGTLELASRLWPESEGWFAIDNNGATFQISTYSGHNDPLGEIVRRLCEPAELVARAEDHDHYPQADRKPVVITPFDLRLDWWLHSDRGGDKSELKTWAGQQTPERNFNGLRGSWRKIINRNSEEIGTRKLFSQRRPTKGRFGLDPASSWEALDVGFSPDEQGIAVQTSPATEILAAIGLQRCRPKPDPDNKRWFAYSVWKDPVEITIAPAVISGIGRTLGAYEFPVVMRNAQYGSFGWARSKEDRR